MLNRITRRAAMALTGVGAFMFARPASASVATPRQTAGPFYPPPRMRPSDTDWDLVRVAGRVRAAGGEVLHLQRGERSAAVAGVGAGEPVGAIPDAHHRL